MRIVGFLFGVDETLRAGSHGTQFSNQGQGWCTHALSFRFRV